ncbi:hypothetical protein [Limnoglobus roseus]|uniref:Uncharacterized protein n=1 Tax=Limnoglobus roseus TaxID=2598579 RepID=A0A5C1ADU5_9BACT|nr:hypothetical protein [Limnoglobus roseus]QEL17549.1 hypothetical protein PX52LOC_04539 [Limnoglobus roseus]
MLRALVALFVVAPLAVAAPPPMGAKKADALYFPTKVGTKRVYEVTFNGTTTELTIVVTAVVEKDGVWRVTEESDDPTSAVAGGKSVMTNEVSDKGVTLVARGAKDLPKPQPLLKLPAKSGDTWDFDPAPANRSAGLQSEATTYVVGKEEDVETPAGKFKAVSVESKRKNPKAERVAGPVAVTQWYAVGAGKVKAVSKIGDRERTMVLKSFTPAK